MLRLAEIVREKDLKSTFEIILTDLEQANLKYSEEWELTDQILSKVETIGNNEEWEQETRRAYFSYSSYLETLRSKVEKLIGLLFKQLVFSKVISFTYENEEVRKDLIYFSEWLKKEGERIIENERDQENKIFEVIIHLKNVNENEKQKIVKLLEECIPYDYEIRGIWTRLVPEKVLELEKELKEKENAYWEAIDKEDKNECK